MTQVVVIDYGMGNLHSVSKALETVADSEKIIISSDLGVIKSSDKIVFPGVGAIKDCMAAFSEDLKETVLEEIGKKPTLAICVGMQMLFSKSEEAIATAGFDYFSGQVLNFSNLRIKGLRVPHTGWNQVQQSQHPLWQGIPDNSYFYFTHSYYVPKSLVASKNIASVTNYGCQFVSALAAKNLFATQFHPEKSDKAGLKLLKNFADWDGSI